MGITILRGYHDGVFQMVANRGGVMLTTLLDWFSVNLQFMLRRATSAKVHTAMSAASPWEKFIGRGPRTLYSLTPRVKRRPGCCTPRCT